MFFKKVLPDPATAESQTPVSVVVPLDPLAATDALAAELTAPPPPPPPPVWQTMVPPTPQQQLLTPDLPGVLQPTASGRLISAKFGSVRTVSRNGRLYPSFHEGVDIAPTTRDRKGEATDDIFAVADGRIAFVNNTAGNSSYGRYIVVEHPDPSLGISTNARGVTSTSMVYTLYAHLADIRFGIRPGREVKAGDEIATMGRSSNTTPPIPRDRAHLHWEVGLMLNPRYAQYTRNAKLQNSFEAYNGQNLFGIDPLHFFAAQSADENLDFKTYLSHVPPAFELLVRRGHFPDFFKSFPELWSGPKGNGEPMWLAVSESGLPLGGRLAMREEMQVLGNQRHCVLRVHETTLGRNARGYVTKKGSRWQLTEKGTAWLDLLFY